MSDCPPVCDTCRFYAFNGDKDGAYTGDGRCEHPEHPAPREPEDGCEDFDCLCTLRQGVCSEGRGVSVTSLPVHVPTIRTDQGPWAEHDQACAVCVQRPAVYECNTGRFQPCWSCQEEGWKLGRMSRLRRRLRRRSG